MPISLEKRNKFGNRPEKLDGFRFDSQAELRRYRELRLLERAEEIHTLRVHPRFPLVVNGIKVGDYVADFVYATADGRVVVEDVKSKPTSTPLYKFKRRFFEAMHGLPIVEVDTRAIR